MSVVLVQPIGLITSSVHPRLVVVASIVVPFVVPVRNADDFPLDWVYVDDLLIAPRSPLLIAEW